AAIARTRKLLMCFHERRKISKTAGGKPRSGYPLRPWFADLQKGTPALAPRGSVPAVAEL
ncbi:MAG: hypothetical protein WEB37_04425, partial [Bacteroidota bacterium]